MGLAAAPRFRQRVVDPPLHLGLPAWTTDPDFDLDSHVRRVRVPDPGSFEQVLDLGSRWR
jgi:diacylglycerol O-acyltransferase